MKVIQNYSLDIEHVEMLNDLKEKAKINKSKLMRKFIRYFSENKEEFEKLIQGDTFID